eukprot:6433514-Amphidinium_carterae.2
MLLGRYTTEDQNHSAEFNKLFGIQANGHTARQALWRTESTVYTPSTVSCRLRAKKNAYIHRQQNLLHTRARTENALRNSLTAKIAKKPMQRTRYFKLIPKRNARVVPTI